MKLQRVFIFLVLFLAFTVGSVGAESGSSHGYIPLLTTIEEGGKTSSQTREAYDKLQIAIFNLTNSGVLINHHVEWNFGIMAVEYKSGADLSTLGTVYEDPNEALSTITFPEKEVNSTAISPVFEVEYSCFYASGLGANAYVDGTMSIKGTVFASFNNSQADASGSLNGCFNGAPGIGIFYSSPPKHYTVRFKVYDSANTILEGSYVTNLPSSTLTSINKNQAIIRGTGRPNKNYEIYTEHSKLDAADTVITTLKNGKTSSTGAFKKDVGGFRLRGGDQIDMAMTINSHFIHHSYYIVPVLSCTANNKLDKTCYSVHLPSHSSGLERIRSGQITAYTPKISLIESGGIRVSLYNNVVLKTGDVVRDTPAGIDGTKIPKLSVSMDAAADTVTVSGPKNSPIYVDFSGYNQELYIDATGKVTDAIGFDVTTADKIVVYVEWISKKTGAVIYMPFTVTPK